MAVIYTEKKKLGYGGVEVFAVVELFLTHL